MARENLLFLAVLASLPIQLNKFFFIDQSYVFGIPIDYRALSFYLSDIPVILLVLFFFIGRLKNLKSLVSHKKNLYITLALFNIYLLLNNLLRPGFPIPLYFSLRILLLSLFFIAANQIISRQKINIHLKTVISISLIWQSALIIFQFVNQHSQGLWFLGERTFDASTVGIAHADILGMQFLRSYGTFPHPNLAGAFLVLGLIFISIGQNPLNSTLKKATTILTVTALFLTFSRSALTVFLLFVLISSPNIKNLIIKLLSLSATFIILSPLLINTQLASIAERITLTKVSLDITASNLLTGVGNTNFLTHLASQDLTSLAQTRLIQPVHNVFLLILAENGILGFSLFIALLFMVSTQAKSKIKVLLFTSILIFASIDHFLWTLHQGQLLFWLSLAIISNENPLRTQAKKPPTVKANHP